MKTLATAAAISLLMTGTALATNPPPNNPPQQQNQGQGQAQGQQQRAYGGAGGAGGAGGNGTGGSQTQSQGTTVNNSNGGGNGTGWNGSQFPVASSYAPSFGVGSMCQEAFSGGLQAFVVGASAGRVYTLQFCKTKMQGDHFRALGREDMAKAAECKDPDFRALYKETGTPCNEDAPKATPAAAAPIVQQPAQQQVLNAGGLQCFDAAGRSVPLGQPGSVRCQ